MSNVFNNGAAAAAPSGTRLGSLGRTLLVVGMVLSLLVGVGLTASARPGNNANNNGNGPPPLVELPCPAGAQNAACVDADGDGVTVRAGDPDDNDPCVPSNSGTPDTDGDGIRDACDSSDDRDADGDGVTVAQGDPDDNDPCVPSSGGVPDVDRDGIRDACDTSDDRAIGRDPARVPPVNSISISGISDGAVYEHGSVPVAGCTGDEATLSLGPVTGPLAAFGLGTQTVTCTVPGVGSTSATFSIVDTTAPILDLPEDILVTRSVDPTQAEGGFRLFQLGGTVVTYSASASDAVTGAAEITCGPASGSAFPTGSTTVTCSATDLAGNDAAGSFLVTVTEAGSGTMPEEPTGGDDEVLGKTVRRPSPRVGAPAGSPARIAGSVLGSSEVKGGTLAVTGAALLPLLLIALVLIVIGVGSAAISRRRETVTPR